MVVACYLRVSTDEQRERQTIAGQRQYAEGYLRQNGLTAAWYEDEGVSGTLPVEKRPAGARLLADVEARRFSLVLVYRIDRLARSLLELLRCVETLDARGVALRSMSEPFDTGSAFGRAFLQLLGIFAELERNSIRERTDLGKARRAAEGAWMGGPAPYGYRLVAGRLAEEPCESEVVREMYRLCLEGYATQGIALLLNARGVPNPRGNRTDAYKHSNRWLHSTIGRIIRNPANRGEGRFRNGAIVMPCPPLVEAETWHAAQAALKGRRRGAAPGQRFYWLTGLLRCDLCGSAASGLIVRDRAGKAWPYYRCSGDPRRGVTCRAPHLPAVWLEEAIWQECRRWLLDPTAALGHLRSRLQETQAAAVPILSEVVNLEVAAREKAGERARVINLVRRGLISDAEAEPELLSLRDELAALEGRIGTLRAHAVTDAEIDKQVSALEVLLNRLRDTANTEDPAERRITAAHLLAEVRIGKVGNERYYRARWVFESSSLG